MTACSCHITYVFQSESTFHSCLNVKELAWCRYEIWSLSDCNWAGTHNHLVHKQTLNHLAKLAKWLSCVVSTSLYGAFIITVIIIIVTFITIITRLICSSFCPS